MELILIEIELENGEVGQTYIYSHEKIEDIYLEKLDHTKPPLRFYGDNPAIQEFR